MKRNEKDLIEALTCLKTKVDGRDEEINKLKGMVQVKPGGLPKDDSDPCSDIVLSLKAAQMQLDILQLRNLQLEKKLQTYASKCIQYSINLIKVILLGFNISDSLTTLTFMYVLFVNFSSKSWKKWHEEGF